MTGFVRIGMSDEAAQDAGDVLGLLVEDAASRAGGVWTGDPPTVSHPEPGWTVFTFTMTKENA